MRVNLTQEMRDILQNYSDEVMEEVTDILEDVGREAAVELHSAGSFKNRSGKYRRGWTSETDKKRTFTSVTVFNKNQYRLTHLLENGHKVAGTDKTVPAYPHIEDVNENAQDKAFDRITKMIEDKE